MRHARDVLQRDPLRPFGDEVGVAFRRRRVPEHQRAQPAQPDAEQVLGQELGVHARAGHAGLREDRRRLADGLREARTIACSHHE